MKDRYIYTNKSVKPYKRFQSHGQGRRVNDYLLKAYSPVNRTSPQGFQGHRNDKNIIHWDSFGA